MLPCYGNPMRTRLLRYGIWLALFGLATATRCTGELERFLEEEKPIAIEILAQTTNTPTYSLVDRTLSFSITFRAKRNGSYRILHGSSCNNGKAPNSVEHSGALQWGVAITRTVALSLDDIAEYGRQIIICATDTANYQKGTQVVSFQSALDYLAAQNEATGNGLPLNSGLTSEFAVFQDNWTSGSTNRGGATAANTVNSPQQFAAFIDPNDNYRIKYFVVDSQNNRVLVFYNRPDAWGSVADVVIGQPGFTSAVGSTNSTGLKIPTTLAVSAAGRLYIADFANHRIMGFHAIPKVNGQAADFVIGQPDFLSNVANNPMLPQRAQWLNQPTTVSVFNGRMYIVDRENNRVLVFTNIPTTTAPAASFAIGQPDLETFSSGGDYTLGNSYLNRPVHITFGNNRLYLSESWTHRVLVFNAVPIVANTKPDHVIGQNDPTGFAANCMSPMPEQNCLNDPGGLAAWNNLLAVADSGNNRVMLFDVTTITNGQNAIAVIGQVHFHSDTSGTSQTELFNPTMVAFDSGYIWISDRNNHRLVVRQLP